MSVLYFKNDYANFWGEKLSKQGILAQTCRLVKSINRQYLSLEAKNDKSKTTLFSQTFKVPENKVPLLFSFSASELRY